MKLLRVPFILVLFVVTFIDSTALTVLVRTDAGLHAVRSLNELALAEAYMNDDIDFEGDFLRVLELRYLLQDRNWVGRQQILLTTLAPWGPTRALFPESAAIHLVRMCSHGSTRWAFPSKRFN